MERIAGLNTVHPMKKVKIYRAVPIVIRVASVGLTEAKAKEQGYKIKVGRFPFMGNGKAIALGEPEGLVKTIFDEKTGELLGAHMVGAEVTEMIQGYVIGKTMEAVEEDFMHTIFPHPTLSEMMHESVLDAYGKVMALLSDITILTSHIHHATIGIVEKDSVMRTVIDYLMNRCKRWMRLAQICRNRARNSCVVPSICTSLKTKSGAQMQPLISSRFSQQCAGCVRRVGCRCLHAKNPRGMG